MISIPVQTKLDFEPDEVVSLETIGEAKTKNGRFIKFNKMFALNLKDGRNYQLDYRQGRWLLNHLQQDCGKAFKRIREHKTAQKTNRKGEVYDYKEVFWKYEVKGN